MGQLITMLGQVGAGDVDPHEEGWAKKLSGGKEGQCSALIEMFKSGAIPPLPPVEVPSSDVPSDPDEFKHRDESSVEDVP